MSDWQAKLAGLNKELLAQEKAENEAKAAVLSGFRKVILELNPIAKGVIEFADAFGADCEWESDRFHDRYPWVRFRIRKPDLEYRVECRDGVIYEQIKEGPGPAKVKKSTLEAMAPKAFERRLTEWVQAAVNANRKMPGKR